MVCPGGGYSFVSNREAEPIALAYSGAGFNVFILTYSVKEYAAYPRPLIQLCKALKWIRENADDFGVKEDNIAVIGFSAGGHLAGSLGVHWNQPEIKEKSGCHNGENRPNAMLLIYPVTTLNWSWGCTGNGLQDYIIGDGDREEISRQFNLPLWVDHNTPPSFLCHTFRDTTVPVEDSLCMANALAKADVPFEMHIFPNGYHGLSLGTAEVNGGYEDPDFKNWLPMSVAWLKRLWNHPEEANAPMKRAKAHEENS